MPKGDRTGPVGTGPRSGRMAGFCRGFNTPGYATASISVGSGMGMGRRYRCLGDPMVQGRGMQRRVFSGDPTVPNEGNQAAPPSRPGDNVEALKHRSRALQAELDALNEQVQALESQKEKKE